MLALDERALTRACQAFLKRDRQLAYSVILGDQDVDALDATLDRLCLEFIVRHQPAGGHLRFVYSASKIVNLLERCGDYAESIARQVLLLSSLTYEAPTEKFNEIANSSCSTRYKGSLKLKDWAFAIAKRSTMRKARIALALSSRHHHACRRRDTAPSSNRRSRAAPTGQEVEPSSRAERRPREGTDDGADFG